MKKGCCDDCLCGCPLGYTAEQDIKRLTLEVEKLKNLGKQKTELFNKYAREVERLREALANIKHEVGVPQPGYPQPVANAYYIAKSALSPETEKA